MHQAQITLLMKFSPMNKFIVGIPSYREADNIAQLTTKVDKVASELNLDITIVNADNDSPDGTSKVFMETPTKSKKVGLVTSDLGKGRNIIAILNYMMMVDEIEFCFFIDADITSFDSEWLEKQFDQYKKNVDYVTPMYKRKYIEGNATNHFAYPVMIGLMGGTAPCQPIAGDIGVSRRLASHILSQQLGPSVYGYGIDLFISTHALSMGGLCSEIILDRKIHKQSFDKMIKIFVDEATSYYAARKTIGDNRSSFRSTKNNIEFLDAEPISESKLAKRSKEAVLLFSDVIVELSQVAELCLKNNSLSAEQWVKILIEHERVVSRYEAALLARSLTPFYLLRTVTYLRENKDPQTAARTIVSQAKMFKKLLKELD